MSAREFESALASRGIDCAVEARDGLAVLIPRDARCDLADIAVRELAIRLGREHGFTHVAVELSREPADA